MGAHGCGDLQGPAYRRYTGTAVGCARVARPCPRLSLEGDGKTTDLPPQARAADISAQRAKLEVEARLHEWRAFSASVGYWNFSDDNRRQALQLAWREGLWIRPRYRLSGRIDLYASNNSRVNAAYFNPRSDRSASLSLTGAWRTYRWYERDFVQELSFSGGAYWQESFGTESISGFEYAHRWSLDDRFYLRYGIGRTLRHYDGQQSGRSYLTLDMDWRF
ncbi:MAG: hypothetical protein FJY37_14075 [Betaproteobacteria bacterium]|nr:hypothetical protein [Betaproteobacteria bacterium]